ncbi:O-methyltransferase, family 3 [Saccharopolyspora erythraea NRRL 2338]|uniref:O-methyltransferase, family 3 n=2 Tax=Saccharopolyspora erythraea TaxID=1836 RepID=A4F8J5_SACEN|nr:O-methyltransferase [Saccharopolyspora erythraea D]QRK90949.1 class I SAM-dependent methyltransferase [Saccharopolyspora erythraea]CAM00370.1 O-methyltransferase, family 3 [Saccharopolyspora erythraea NRRL 2338]
MIPETPIGPAPVGRESARSRLSGGRRPGAVPGDGDDATGDMTPGQVLRFLAAALCARAVVEIGTGDGERSLSLLRGMVPDGVLTSIDLDPVAQRNARRVLAEAGMPSGRARLITGLATEVMARLTEGGYDMVSVGGAKTDYPAYLELGLRLLRPGGVIVFGGIRPGQEREHGRDPESMALRELARRVQEDETLVTVGLPVGDGLLAIAQS